MIGQEVLAGEYMLLPYNFTKDGVADYKTPGILDVDTGCFIGY